MPSFSRSYECYPISLERAVKDQLITSYSTNYISDHNSVGLVLVMSVESCIRTRSLVWNCAPLNYICHRGTIFFICEYKLLKKLSLLWALYLQEPFWCSFSFLNAGGFRIFISLSNFALGVPWFCSFPRRNQHRSSYSFLVHSKVTRVTDAFQ